MSETSTLVQIVEAALLAGGELTAPVEGPERADDAGARPRHHRHRQIPGPSVR